jgi:hypothetical protein
MQQINLFLEENTDSLSIGSALQSKMLSLVKQFRATNKTVRKAVAAYNSDKPKALETFGDISSWDMSKLFSSCTTFNENINMWDVSNVTGMSSMFNGATSILQSTSAFMECLKRSQYG